MGKVIPIKIPNEELIRRWTRAREKIDKSLLEVTFDLKRDKAEELTGVVRRQHNRAITALRNSPVLVYQVFDAFEGGEEHHVWAADWKNGRVAIPGLGWNLPIGQVLLTEILLFDFLQIFATRVPFEVSEYAVNSPDRLLRDYFISSEESEGLLDQTCTPVGRLESWQHLAFSTRKWLFCLFRWDAGFYPPTGDVMIGLFGPDGGVYLPEEGTTGVIQPGIAELGTQSFHQPAPRRKKLTTRSGR